MTQSSSQDPTVWRISLMVGAIAGVLTLVNIILGATVLAIPDGTPDWFGLAVTENLFWGELIANLALYALSGILVVRRGLPAAIADDAGIRTGAATGATGAVVATLINIVSTVFWPHSVRTFYDLQLGYYGPPLYGGFSDTLRYWGGWGILVFFSAVIASGLFGAIGGFIGRRVWKRALRARAIR